VFANAQQPTDSEEELHLYPHGTDAAVREVAIQEARRRAGLRNARVGARTHDGYPHKAWSRQFFNHNMPATGRVWTTIQKYSNAIDRFRV